MDPAAVVREVFLPREAERPKVFVARDAVELAFGAAAGREDSPDVFRALAESEEEKEGWSGS